MLKSISLIKRLEKDLNINIKLEKINNFFIELRINQKIYVHIVSDTLNNKNILKLENVEIVELGNNNIIFTFIKKSQSENDEFKYLFEKDKVSLGLRRSLGALIQIAENGNELIENIVTFFSYKGGVGRTTALATTATYLARKGKNVFVMDCDLDAPGLINFFNTSQSSKFKSGLVEYLNDELFDKDNDINDYVYAIEKTYSGSGNINLMHSGNILSDEDDLDSYLEGLAKLDSQGYRLISIFKKLISSIQSKFNPDIILIDSKTGFNNIFGALAHISKYVVVLAGDDIQNQPGIDYIGKLFNKAKTNPIFVLSILNGSNTRRFNSFKTQIHNMFDHDTETFYFDRSNTLELIGTSMGDDEDLNDFINGEGTSSNYQKFFQYIEQLEVNTNKTLPLEKDNTSNTELQKQQNLENDFESGISLQDKILENIKKHLPNLYAENIEYDDNYINNTFYIRPCMEDFFIPEKTILLGDKGTGKTAFFKALQIENFFKKLEIKTQRKHLNYEVLNITNFEEDGFRIFDFEDQIDNDLFINKFWIYLIWNAICSRGDYISENKNFITFLDKTKSTTQETEIKKIINNNSSFSLIESELFDINNKYKSKDCRLIITFDRLDNIVEPKLWNKIISPLVKLCIISKWNRIFPKLFLRRDLYERLGNLTNKNSFSTRIINLEWSRNEMFSYFLKMVFLSSKDDFFKYLESHSDPKVINIKEIRNKLKTKEIVHNQLPLETNLIKPIINQFFGDPKSKNNKSLNTAYDSLYRNIQSADYTVNLRPFIDLIKYAIDFQDKKDNEQKNRKESILSIIYCTNGSVRASAVTTYLSDLWSEEGNEFVKLFCIDFSNDKVDDKYKKNMLAGHEFDSLVLDVKNRNYKNEPSLKDLTIEDLKQILIANKIITPYIKGNKIKYAFAYLYTNYLKI